MTYTIMDSPLVKAAPLMPELHVLLIGMLAAGPVAFVGMWALGRTDSPALRYGLIAPAMFAVPVFMWFQLLPFLSAPGILPLMFGSLMTAVGMALPFAAVAAILLVAVRR